MALNRSAIKINPFPTKFKKHILGGDIYFGLSCLQKNISVYLLTVDKAKFRKTVCPGDTLFHKVEKKQNVKNIWKFKCTSFVNQQLVAEAEVSAIINSSL